MTTELVLIVVTLTSYQPVKAQTDDSPTWTSIGDRTTKFGAAVSQDFLKDGRLKYGDVLYVPGFGYRVVNDCMNARHKNALDLLVLTHAEEKKVGVRKNFKVYKVVVKPGGVNVGRGKAVRPGASVSAVRPQRQRVAPRPVNHSF